MKDYKGLYHNDKSIMPCFEHGAHFKYLDLVNALKELQEKVSNKNEKENEALTYSPIKNETLLIKEKLIKPKKFKLKTNVLNSENKDNKRYREITYSNENEESEEDILIKQRKRNNEFKRFKGMSKSLDRKEEKLPLIKINNSNSISLRNNSFNPHKLMERIIYDFNEDENIINKELREIGEYNSKIKHFEMRNILNEISNRKLHKSKKNIRKFENIFPKINSVRGAQAVGEEQTKNINIEDIEEEETIFENNNYIENNEFSKIQNSINANKIKVHPLKKKSHKGLSRLYLNDLSKIKKNDMKDNDENQKSRFVLNGRLRSIFQTEKQLKSYNLLTDRIHNKEKTLDKINNNIAQEIYKIKKNLLIDKNKEEN